MKTVIENAQISINQVRLSFGKKEFEAKELIDALKAVHVPYVPEMFSKLLQEKRVLRISRGKYQFAAYNVHVKLVTQAYTAAYQKHRKYNETHLQKLLTPTHFASLAAAETLLKENGYQLKKPVIMYKKV